MQVQTNSSFYQSFGGLNFMDSDINKLKIPDLITKHLGLRSMYATYSYADIIKSVTIQQRVMAVQQFELKPQRYFWYFL